MFKLSTENNTLGLLQNTSALLKRITLSLKENPLKANNISKDIISSPQTSSVLFLIGSQRKNRTDSLEPCLILNKRSRKVRQPGDLCCPGGSISLQKDSYIAKLLLLPGSPLYRWPYWSAWRSRKNPQARVMALLFATSLREGFEEMRLNPMGLQFLGPLPPQRLVTFNRIIYPMVCWLSRQKRFRPNWEVEKVVYIPLKNLLNPSNYACYRVHIKGSSIHKKENIGDVPCFIHKHMDETERLWGATYRITMVFLDLIFKFRPPALETLPVVFGELNENYRTGSADMHPSN